MAKKNSERDPAPEAGLRIIPRRSLKDMAVQQIREAIERGELEAGETLTELGLARKLGVAQPTVREALLELEFLGFIERQGPRKTRVTLLSQSAIRDIYLVRARLEVLAAELVAAQADRTLSACHAAVLAMEQAAHQGNAVEFYQADLSFHRELWQATENQSLQSCLEQLVPKLMTFSIIQKARPSRTKLRRIASSHRDLLEVIATGNTRAAAKIMLQSMKDAQADDEQLPHGK